MAITIPNLDRIQKDWPKLGEAISKLRDYINTNVTPVPGNRKPPPPSTINPTRPPG
jgi:hypothetical protein